MNMLGVYRMRPWWTSPCCMGSWPRIRASPYYTVVHEGRSSGWPTCRPNTCLYIGTYHKRISTCSAPCTAVTSANQVLPSQTTSSRQYRSTWWVSWFVWLIITSISLPLIINNYYWCFDIQCGLVITIRELITINADKSHFVSLGRCCVTSSMNSNYRLASTDLYRDLAQYIDNWPV